MLKNSAIAAMLSLALILTGCASLPGGNGDTDITATLQQARNIVVSVQTTAPELVVIGDLSQEDADWLLENTQKALPLIDLAIRISSGVESGDPIEQIDAAIAMLRTARDSAGSPTAAEVLGRVTAALVFYRSMLVNQPTGDAKLSNIVSNDVVSD